MLARPDSLAWITRVCGLFLLAALLLGLPPVALAGPQAGIPVASAAPAVTLDPARGSCTTRVTANGSGFTPGVTVRFILTRDRDGAVTAANSQGGGQPARSDGTYSFTISLSGCGPDEPIGSTFTITMFEYRSGSTPNRGPEASAKFTVTAPGTTPGLPNTGGGWSASSAASSAGATLLPGVRFSRLSAQTLGIATILLPLCLWFTLDRKRTR